MKSYYNFVLPILRPSMRTFYYRYSMRRRHNVRRDAESAREQPPSYDNAVQEEDKIARQNVARYEMEACDQEDTTDDRAPLTGP